MHPRCSFRRYRCRCSARRTLRKAPAFLVPEERWGTAVGHPDMARLPSPAGHDRSDDDGNRPVRPLHAASIREAGLPGSACVRPAAHRGAARSRSGFGCGIFKARVTLSAMTRVRFQTFDDPSHRQGAARIRSLREALRADGLDGFVVPRADEHQSEYVAPGAERLAWLTGFTGSAGTAVVLADTAALVVDGRYTLQAPAQVDTDVVTPVPLAETSMAAWAGANLKAGQVLGYDPWLHTPDGVARLERAVARAGATLRAVEANRSTRSGPTGRRPPPGRGGASAGTGRGGDRRQARAHPHRAGAGRGRGPGDLGPAQPRLGLQPARRGRGAYAAGARLRDPAPEAARPSI